VLCCVVLYCAMLCYVVLCCVVLCCVVLCCVVLCCVVLCCVVLCLLCCVVLCCVVLCCVVLKGGGVVKERDPSRAMQQDAMEGRGNVTHLREMDFSLPRSTSGSPSLPASPPPPLPSVTIIDWT